MGKSSQYGVILDAGSSGTRVYVYKWKHPAQAVEHASSSARHALPKLKLEKSKKIHPGVSSFAENAAAVGYDHLQSLIEVAIDEIPSSKIPETPVFLMATAGVRFLPQYQQTALLQQICTYLQANTKFHLPDCATHVQVISGETEGLYGWIAANYLLGGFKNPVKDGNTDGHTTYGFLDMGGASAQIAFAPNATESERHADDLKIVRMRTMDGYPLEYKVFTSTWLGFGANKARQRYIQNLENQYGQATGDIPDPCLPKGLRMTLKDKPITTKSDQNSGEKQVLVGTGMFDECLRNTYPLLGKDMPCKDQPCLLNGQHAPAIDFSVNHFVGVSEYWHTTHGVFGKDENTAYDLISYQQKVSEFCSQEWTSIEGNLERRKKTLEEQSENAREACFKASWLINLLYEGIGIPRIGLDHRYNATKTISGGSKDKNPIEPFQPVDTIDGIEVSWTLGKMVLYASGQVSPKGAILPVGFGSNVASGTPTDFEHAGSTPLTAGFDGDNDDQDDNDITSITKSSNIAPMLLFIALLVFVAYILRKPERRRKLFTLTRRNRKAKPGRGFSLTSKLFGRNTAAYDRIMEEGEAAEFELGGIDSDDNEQSDSTDSSRPTRAPRITPTPRLTIERAGELQPPSAIDRHGLVVRTESYERLAPTLQMLNAGRRSRTGSPTRLKSPLVTPPQVG